jgi:outer membrane receptor protein involved in Fe transport
MPRFAALRAGALGTLGLAALVAACDTRMPTAPEVEAMDVAAAETQAKKFEIVSKDGQVTYFVDGKQATAEEARKLGGDRIARMEMIRSKSGDGAEFHVTTVTARVPGTQAGGQRETYHMKVAGEMVLDSVAEEKRILFRSSAAGGDRVATLYPTVAAGDTGRVRVRVGNSNGPPPLVILDGVRVEASRLNGMDPDQIKEIEVIKGQAATRLYDDPRAVNGVIRITTKAGAPKP